MSATLTVLGYIYWIGAAIAFVPGFLWGWEQCKDSNRVAVWERHSLLGSGVCCGMLVGILWPAFVIGLVWLFVYFRMEKAKP